MRWALSIIVLSLWASPALAQELVGLGGVTEETGTHSRNSSWQIDYMEGVGAHFAFSFSTLNEGHFPSHHRDGLAAQLWGRTGALDRRLSLAAGIGSYYYNDTIKEPGRGFDLNDHGWGAIASLAATWYTESRWLFQLRTNWIGTRDSIDTLSAQVGVGYRFDPLPSPGPLPEAPGEREKTAENEITAFIGQTSVHNEGPGHSSAAGIEYRRALWRHVEWSVAWLYEGENSQARRQGLVTQLWAVSGVLDDRLTFAVGGGPYFAVDRLRGPQGGRDDSVFTATAVTMSSSYRFLPRWDMRASWNRIITSYHRDADVYLAGIGYRF